MPKTVALDDDIYSAAACLAEAERRSVEEVLSGLLRQILIAPPSRLTRRNGFPVFDVSKGAPQITSETVRAVLEDEGGG